MAATVRAELHHSSLWAPRTPCCCAALMRFSARARARRRSRAPRGFLQLLDPFLDGRRRRFGTFAFSTGHPLRETFPVGLRPLAVLLRERVELVVERHSPLLEFADAAVEVGYVGPPVPPEGEAPMYAALLGGEVAHDRAMMEAEQAAVLAKILCETESAEPPTAAGTTSGGDEARLRGLPAIGRGVSGAIPGTSPVGAVMRKEKSGGGARRLTLARGLPFCCHATRHVLFLDYETPGLAGFR